MLAELTNISKTIPDGTHKRELLTEINLSIEDNDIIALVGTSGAGKTALLRGLSCLEVFYQGSYQFNNIQVVNMPESGLANIRRNYMGFIGFEPEFLNNMTVSECLNMPLFNISFRERKKRVIDILEFIGLLSKLKTPIHKLQYYERMYISIARAFIKKPLLVVADDPGKQLHSSEALALLDLTSALRREYGGALIYSTYDPALLKKAGKIIYMKNGKILKMEVL